MHIIRRIHTFQDPWKRVALLSLQQLTEDMSIHDKRVRALEKTVMALAETIAPSGSEEQPDLGNVTAALRDIHDEIRVWSKRSLDQTEDLVLAIKLLVSDQQLGDLIPSPEETERLAS